MKKLIVGTLALFFACQSAQAETIFSCLTKTAKQILVEKEGNYYFYSYGKFKEKPELVLKNRVADVLTREGTGVNMFASDERSDMVFANGNYEYRVYSFIKSSPGVEVSKNGKELATIECKKVIVDSLYDELPKPY